MGIFSKMKLTLDNKRKYSKVGIVGISGDIPTFRKYLYIIQGIKMMLPSGDAIS